MPKIPQTQSARIERSIGNGCDRSQFRAAGPVGEGHALDTVIGAALDHDAALVHAHHARTAQTGIAGFLDRLVRIAAGTEVLVFLFAQPPAALLFTAVANDRAHAIRADLQFHILRMRRRDERHEGSRRHESGQAARGDKSQHFTSPKKPADRAGENLHTSAEERLKAKMVPIPHADEAVRGT